ncbi:uncharacterized protein EDB91DRAFT_1118341, partial [Suillus paluster]|uniref:uncharacterized protein n=1 Tax=Suillus paluster TaxID=48578 RepID=UPI001B86C497
MISTVFNGAAHLTIIGYLSVAHCKEVVLDSTVQLIRDAENVSDLGGIALNFCISPAILILASNKAARIFLSGINKEPAPKHAQPSPPFAGDISTQPNVSSSSNVIATEASPIAAYSTTPYSPWLHSTPIPRPQRFSLDSDTTVVAHDDGFVKDTPGSSRPVEASRTTKPPLKPPDETHHQRTPTSPTYYAFTSNVAPRQTEGKYASCLIAARVSIARSHFKQDNIMISHLEQVYDEILVDQAALVDGWAAAMAELGLTSMLSPPPLSLPNTIIPEISA